MAVPATYYVLERHSLSDGSTNFTDIFQRYPVPYKHLIDGHK